MADLKPLVIGINPNENTGRETNPHVPWTADEIADVAAASEAAGASVMHFHARTADGGAAHDPAAYAEAVRAIRRRSRLLLAPAMAAGPTARDRFENVAALQSTEETAVELLAIDPGAANLDAIDPATGRFATRDRTLVTTVGDQEWLLEQADRHGLRPYLASFNLSWTRTILAHVAAGRVPRPLVLLLVLGGPAFVAAHPTTSQAIDAHLDVLPPDLDVEWLVSSHRGDVLEVADHVVRRGGHVVIGTGDHDHPGLGLPTTPELVERVAAVGRAHGRRPATPDEARRLLGVVEHAHR